jgi:hypothetical protein
MPTPNSTRTITTIKQPYQTSGGETLYLGTETTVQVDANGKYIPNSAEISLRLYTGTGVLGTDYKTVAIRNAGEQWRLTQDGNQNYVAGVDLRQTLANRNSMMNINLNNHVSNALQAPLQGVPAGQVNTNTQSSANAAAGLAPTAGNARPDPPGSPAPPGPPAPPDPSSLTLQPLLTDEEFNGQFKTKDINYGVLRYPKLQHKEETFDYLKIDVLKYVKSGLIQSGSERLDLARPSERLKDILGTVILPMQPNISDSNGVSWNEDQLNAIQGAFAGNAYTSIAGAGNIGSAQDAVRAVTNLLDSLGDTIGTLANSKGMSELIAGYFAEQAVGANVIGRATGAVINNNLELLFAGPKLRTFRYSYKFTPRSKDEAKEVKQIIRLFKREMSTSRSDTGLFLQTPNVFQLKYIYNNGKQGSGNQHPFLNKIKPCALTNFSVNYTPDGTYMTYADGGSMTSYAVDMEFSELEPIYKEDYDTDEGKKGMGY